MAGCENHSRRLPDFLRSISLRHVKLGYNYLVSHLLTLILTPPIAVILDPGVHSHLLSHLQCNLDAVLIASAILVFVLALYLMTRPRTVFLVDFVCHRPPDHLQIPTSKFIRHSRLCGQFDDSSIDFQLKILDRSGLGEETYFPEGMHHLPPTVSMSSAWSEAKQVAFGALDQLLASTSVRPRDIGILVVNCSLFNPAPSLPSMIVNRYHLRGNIRTFNLGGMGCSASVVAVDLARDLLQVHRNTLAIVLSTENITQNCYFGKQKSMLIPNCLFRVGAAAVLLSNRAGDRRRSKYRLVHIVRTHCGADEAAFRCIHQDEDERGWVGVSLSKNLVANAGRALKANITTLGPLVLPVSEQLIFFATLVAKKLFNAKVKPYVPDFKLTFDHFCIHPGGRAVIDELEKNLDLLPLHVEAARMTLHRFGNTSSSTIWYELAYIEAKGRMRKGQRVWQIAFGSGFKCNSAVWEALRNVKPSPDTAWAECIHRYPVKIAGVTPSPQLQSS